MVSWLVVCWDSGRVLGVVEHSKGFIQESMDSWQVLQWFVTLWEALWHSAGMHIVDGTKRVSFDATTLWRHMGSFFSPLPLLACPQL